MRPRADLVYRAAKYLGVIRAGDALSSEDYASIDEEIESLITNLNARGITYIQDSVSIEDAGFLPLARILAATVCADFAIPLNALAGFENEPMKSERELRALGRANANSCDVIRADNF